MEKHTTKIRKIIKYLDDVQSGIKYIILGDDMRYYIARGEPFRIIFQEAMDKDLELAITCNGYSQGKWIVYSVELSSSENLKPCDCVEGLK